MFPSRKFIITLAMATGLLAVGLGRQADAAGLVADINGDGVVDQSDINVLESDWGSSNASADLNGDGKVDIFDLSILLANFGKTSGTTATFGNTTPGSGWTTGLISDDKFVEQFDVPQSGSVTKLTYYLRGDSGSSQVAKAIIYADNGGAPGALLGQGSEVTVAANQAAGWVTFPFSSPVSISSGNVWIGLIRGPTGGNIDIATNTTGGVETYANNLYSSGASDPFGAEGGTSTDAISGYATYLTGSGNSQSLGTGSGIGIYSLGGSISSQSHLSGYQTIIVDNDASEASQVCGLASPTRALIYFAASDVNQSYNTGVDWTTANANGWLLKDSSGNLLVNQGFQGNNVADVGNPAFQQAWINNVVSTVQAYHCHGVFIDDILKDISTLAGEYPAKYPNQAAWEAATVSFVKAVGTALKADGIYVAGNVSGYVPGSSASDDGTSTAAFWQEVGPYLNGMMNEYYDETSDGSDTLRSTGSNWNQHWDSWQQLIDVAQSQGDDFIGEMYDSSTDAQAMRYGKGSFLLEWNGGGSVFGYANGGPAGSGDFWNSAWTYNIGQPTAAKSEPQPNVWQRTYTNGVVIVNTTNASVTVAGHTIAGTDAYIGP